jgi:hypothetical protein
MTSLVTVAPTSLPTTFPTTRIVDATSSPPSQQPISVPSSIPSVRPSKDVSGQDELVTCVSVIDENDSKDVNRPYEDLRAKYPNRTLCLLQPDDAAVSRTGKLSFPSDFFNSTLNIFSKVTRDFEDSNNTSDWYAICDLEDGRLQGISNVVLFVDNSGSMRNSTVQNALSRFVTQVNERGMRVINAVYNNNEDYISPCLLTDLVTSAPSFSPSSSPG